MAGFPYGCPRKQTPDMVPPKNDELPVLGHLGGLFRMSSPGSSLSPAPACTPGRDQLTGTRVRANDSVLGMGGRWVQKDRFTRKVGVQIPVHFHCSAKG